MKTLIINGSPRKRGDTMQLISEMQKYLKGDVKIISTYSDNISPCIDCRFCWRNEGCSIKDDMPYDYIADCDNIIFASPIYFSELTGSFLNTTSRVQTYFAAKFFRKVEPNLKKKKAVLILTGGANCDTQKAESTAQIILKDLNAELVGKVCALDTDNTPTSLNRQALDRARELSILLNQQ